MRFGSFGGSGEIVTVSVVHPVVSNANCFSESDADTVVVDSMSALGSAVNSAPPGRQILIAPGAYIGGSMVFNRDGTEENPIVIRPQIGLGTVRINDASWIFEQTSSRLVMEKLLFTSASIVLSGDHNRISRCRFTSVDHTVLQVGDGSGRGARDCRIDHCEFDDFNNPTAVGINYINLRGRQFDSGNTARLLVDYCRFTGINVTQPGGTGQEVIGSYTSPAGIGVDRGQSIIVDHCLFDDIYNTGGGESEMVTMKQGGWIIRFCTFINTNQEVTFRATSDSELRSCWFESGDQVRVHGDNHLIIGNRILSGDNFSIMCGNATTDGMINQTDPIDGYARCANNRIIGNRLDTGFIVVGEWYRSIPATTPALNNVLFGNTRDSGGNAHMLRTSAGGFSPAQSGTTFPGGVPETWVPAVKLTATDVGLNAPDPLCD